jgi:methylmalonyl-CoA mutase
VVELLDVDNLAVRRAQTKSLERVRANRDPGRVDATLAALTRAAKRRKDNLLGLMIGAVRARATVGEISDAFEEAFGRYRALIRATSGIYGGQHEGDDAFRRVQR